MSNFPATFCPATFDEMDRQRSQSASKNKWRRGFAISEKWGILELACHCRAIASSSSKDDGLRKDPQRGQTFLARVIIITRKSTIVHFLWDFPSSLPLCETKADYSSYLDFASWIFTFWSKSIILVVFKWYSFNSQSRDECIPFGFKSKVVVLHFSHTRSCMIVAT